MWSSRKRDTGARAVAVTVAAALATALATVVALTLTVRAYDVANATKEVIALHWMSR